MLRKSLIASSLIIGSLLMNGALNCLPGFCSGWKAVGDLPAYLTVSPELYRGGQPSIAGIRQLKEMGIKTVISLRNNPALTKLESKEATKLGLRFVSIPLTGIQKPSNTAIDQFLQIVGDKESQPVFVHCEFGVDRTGTMVAIYRVATEHWKAQDAYREMVHNGFHPMYAWLADAVFDYEERIGKTSVGRPLGVKLFDSFDVKNLFGSSRKRNQDKSQQPLS
jgi:protein tyrosine phosphatase (PTP) superfamily phosphohydrolase (DUF442 family)